MKLLLSLLLILFVVSACSRGDSPIATSTITAVADSVPDGYIKYINSQASLAAGQYTLVISSQSVGQSGAYTLDISYDDGTTETRKSIWQASSGPGTSCDGLKRPCETIILKKAGGMKLVVSSSIASSLSLKYRNGSLVCDNSVSAICSISSGTTSRLSIHASQIDNEQYATAYYAKVDPNNERTTLAAFKAKNGFGSGSGTEAEAVFRDVKDLGYGRRMLARKNADGTMAFVVENYLVDLEPGSTSNYGPLNVEAAADSADKFHVGTNTIEFSPLTIGGENVVKFYTFNPIVDEAKSTRKLSIDMDGRGNKSVPGLCLSCHGGRALPLGKDGRFQEVSATSAQLNLLEADSFEFSAQVGFSSADFADAIRVINEAVLESYPNTDTAPVGAGKWDSSYAREVAIGRYDKGSYKADFIPEGWKDGKTWVQDTSKSNPTGTALLFKQVVEPHCFSCHSLQGTAQKNQEFIATSVNFSSYEKFKRFDAEIVEYVYKQGNMPLSLRNYERFWLDTKGAPTLLASHLGSAFDVRDGSGNLEVREPGLPFARAGANRTVKFPVKLNGNGSLMASTYRWSIISQPAGASARFNNSALMETELSGSVDGDYVVQLKITNALGSSTDEVSITVNSGLSKGQRELSFATDIRPILGSAQNPATSSCVQCHSDGSAFPSIPLLFTDNKSNLASVSLYADVLARVNLQDPENSLLLRKPSGINHAGAVQAGFTSPSDTAYQTVLNWIRAGALP